ncbi:hypothetical protein KJ695_03160 [Patescibacteria group bacterium]|nr:hypothetical protein [Patescibacteria group bacterium]MBU4056880.1 hypothetical protein [Patescibacteria group bacterium]MBU4368604.1 hypothetical protein [Patescibacteria group bacterium]
MREKEKFYLSVAAIFAVCSVFAWQGIIETKKLNDYEVAKIVEKKTIIAEYGLKEKYLSKSLSNYNFAVNKIAEMRKYFVNNNDLPDFIKTLENLADKTSNSLEISFVSVPAPPADSSVGANSKKTMGEKGGFTMQLAVKGSFGNLIKFISYLESMPYYAYIDSINIGADPKKESSGIRSTLVVKVFSFDNMSIRGL